MIRNTVLEEVRKNKGEQTRNYAPIRVNATSMFVWNDAERRQNGNLCKECEAVDRVPGIIEVALTLKYFIWRRTFEV